MERKSPPLGHWPAECYMRTVSHRKPSHQCPVTDRCPPVTALPYNSSWEAGAAYAPGHSSRQKAGFKAQMKPGPSLQLLWKSPGYCFLQTTLKLLWSSLEEGRGHHWDAPPHWDPPPLLPYEEEKKRRAGFFLRSKSSVYLDLVSTDCTMERSRSRQGE